MDGLFVVAAIISSIANLLAAYLVFSTEKINRANIEFCKWFMDETVKGREKE